MEASGEHRALTRNAQRKHHRRAPCADTESLNATRHAGPLRAAACARTLYWASGTPMQACIQAHTSAHCPRKAPLGSYRHLLSSLPLHTQVRSGTGKGESSPSPLEEASPSQQEESAGGSAKEEAPSVASADARPERAMQATECQVQPDTPHSTLPPPSERVLWEGSHQASKSHLPPRLLPHRAPSARTLRAPPRARPRQLLPSRAHCHRPSLPH